MHLEYVRIHTIYRVYQAECVIHILVVAPQEYVNIYSTRRVGTRIYFRDSGSIRLLRTCSAVPPVRCTSARIS